jgi:hypothetical protein
VDQALSRVCEGLLSFGPGSKSKLNGWKKKNKNKNKKKSCLVDGWLLSECGCVEDGSLLPLMMLVEGTQQ